MKPLDQYQTPETDALRRQIPEPRAIQRMIASHSDLERRLAAQTEALRAIARRSPIMGSTGYYRQGQLDALHAVAEQAREILDLTKPQP